MSKSVVIRGVTYSDVPSVTIPLSSGSGDAEFYDISDATISSNGQMLSGVKSHGADGTLYTGSITTKSGTDLTVSGATVTVPAGYYSSSASKSVAAGTVVPPASISGENATIVVNNGALLFGKTVSATPVVSTAGYVSSGTAGNVDVSLSAAVNTVEGTTYHPSLSDQTIASGSYIYGSSPATFKAVTTTNLTAANIVYGVTVKVGDSTDDDCVKSVTGSAQIPVISQDSTTKVLSIS